MPGLREKPRRCVRGAKAQRRSCDRPLSEARPMVTGVHLNAVGEHTSARQDRTSFRYRPGATPSGRGSSCA